MKHPLVSLVLRWTVLALGVALSARLVPGIHYDDGGTLFLVVVLLGLFNAILKPLLLLFTLPFIVLTMGLGVWLINALLFMEVSRLVPGFHVTGFGAALWGALIVSVTNFVVSMLLGRARVRRGGAPRPPQNPNDVIDI